MNGGMIMNNENTNKITQSICEITGKPCPYTTNEYGMKPCQSECEIGKEYAKNFTPIHDDF